jgi:hypothetical protein
MKQLCPTCNSYAPHLHPAVQWDGEVHVCSDEFHLQETPMNLERYRQFVRDRRQDLATAEANDLDPRGLEYMTNESSDLASALAHRACCGTEHDPSQGKLHGCCVVCGVEWPCETAKYFLRGTVEGASPTRLEELQCEHDALLRGRVPTHRCKICGALWILWAAQPNKYPAGHPLSERSWSLFSLNCGKCCDNVAMVDQIEPIKLAAPIERAEANDFDPKE